MRDEGSKAGLSQWVRRASLLRALLFLRNRGTPSCLEAAACPTQGPTAPAPPHLSPPTLGLKSSSSFTQQTLSGVLEVRQKHAGTSLGPARSPCGTVSGKRLVQVCTGVQDNDETKTSKQAKKLPGTTNILEREKVSYGEKG